MIFYPQRDEATLSYFNASTAKFHPKIKRQHRYTEWKKSWSVSGEI